MAEAGHDLDAGAGDRFGGADRVFRGAGIVVLPGQQVERAALGVDQVRPVAVIRILPVEVEVAAEHAGTALEVGPEGFPAMRLRRLGRDEAGDHRGADLAAVHVGPVQPGRVVPRHLVVGRLEADQGAEPPGVPGGDVEHDPPADRAAHQHRPVELQHVRDGKDRPCIGLGGEPVLLVLVTGRGERLAVPRHVEGDHPVVRGHRVVEHQVPVLAAVGAGGVQAEERYALPRLLEEQAARPAVELQRGVAAGDRFVFNRHRRPPAPRGAAPRAPP